MSPAGAGVFVASFIGREDLATALDRLKSLGWKAETAQTPIASYRPLAGLTTFAHLRPV